MNKLVLLLPLFLVGCGLFQPKVQIVEVKIPVATVPTPPMIKRPKLETSEVSVSANGYAEYVKALEADMVRMETYTFNLENIINTYDQLSKKLDNASEKGTTNVNSN